MADNIFGNLTHTNQDFDGAWHTLGARAAVSVAANLVGGRARWPNSTPGNFLWIVWRADTQAIVAQANLLTAVPSPTLDAWNEFTSAAFQTPGDVALDTALQYVVAVATNGDFLYRTGFTYPVGSGIVTAAEGRFNNGGSGAVFPTGVDTADAFFADVIVAPAGPVVGGRAAAVAVATSTAIKRATVAGSAVAIAVAWKSPLDNRHVAASCYGLVRTIHRKQIRRPTGTVARPVAGSTARPDSGATPRP